MVAIWRTIPRLDVKLVVDVDVQAMSASRRGFEGLDSWRGGDQESGSRGFPEVGDLHCSARSHSPGFGSRVHAAASIFWAALDQRSDASGVVGHSRDAER